MGTASAVTVALVLVACRPERPPSPEHRVSAYLASHDAEQLDRESFHQIVVEPFRSLYNDYARTPYVVPRGPVRVRRHFANDTSLTPAQARLRWALPVMYPAYAGAGTVFVEVRGEWRTLAGLDEALLARVRALDSTCADRLARAGAPGSCTDVGWMIADSALRGEQARFVRACQLASTACIEQ